MVCDRELLSRVFFPTLRGNSRGMWFSAIANKHLTRADTNPSLRSQSMAENIPNTPSGAVPPKPTEAAKVQPKKETVRINLPPKPTAAPTIKIPAPASGAAASAATAGPSGASTVPGSLAHAPPTPAPRAVAAAGRPIAPMRPAIMMAGVSGLDKALAITAAVVALLLLARVVTL